jgi:DNA-binding PadR family transcriptional regulator
MSVRCALLGLLAERPRNGYELRSAFEALVGGGENWDVKPAQVYTTLERLEAAGLVERLKEGGADAPGKGVYAITEAGRASLREWFAEGADAHHGQDEFFVKLVSALLSGEADPADVIQTQRVHLLKQLHDATAIRDSFDPGAEMAQILLLDKAMMRLEADIRWLDIAERRLEDVKRQPPRRPESRPRGRPRKGNAI